MIPYRSGFPWHDVQIHHDSFSYGEVKLKSDPRVVVGKSEILETNKVKFELLIKRSGRWEPGLKDIYGMPQATDLTVQTETRSLN